MDEKERAFIERLKQTYGDAPFAPAIALEEFYLSELPDVVAWELTARGAGIGATKRFTSWLAEAGAVRHPYRTRHGYLWRIPATPPTVPSHSIAPYSRPGAVCEKCGRETGALVRHQRHCTAASVRIERSGCHAQPESTLRPAQRLLGGVTELDVARVMHGLESGVRLYLTPGGRWCAPTDTNLTYLSRLSPTVKEMIRTGLVRHWRDRNGDHLATAKVHLLGPDGLSACHFAGETLGPMRSRLSRDMTVVDCLDCEQAAQAY